nr:hypothetical protein [Saccharomonospora saliphila]
MKLNRYRDIVGISLSTIGEAERRASRRSQRSWRASTPVGGAVRMLCAHGGGVGVSDAGTGVALRPAFADRPSAKQFWVPLCPRGRAP